MLTAVYKSKKKADTFLFVEKRDDFRPKRGTLSIAKARKLLKWKPSYTLKQGLEITASYYKDQS